MPVGAQRRTANMRIVDVGGKSISVLLERGAMFLGDGAIVI